MYQIFPDRFYCSGKPKTGVPADRRLHQSWQEEPQSTPDADGEFRCNDYFGGDLAGITEKLPALAELGVRVIYLNPIFEAHSNHRYQTLPIICASTRFWAMRRILSPCAGGRMSWISRSFWTAYSTTPAATAGYFNKEGRYGAGGACRDPHSPYRSWYCWKDPAANLYESWWGFQSLPKLNSRDKSWREFLCGENGIVRHWLASGRRWLAAGRGGRIPR